MDSRLTAEWKVKERRDNTMPNRPTNLMVPPEDMFSDSTIVGRREGDIHYLKEIGWKKLHNSINMEYESHFNFLIFLSFFFSSYQMLAWITCELTIHHVHILETGYTTLSELTASSGCSWSSAILIAAFTASPWHRQIQNSSLHLRLPLFSRARDRQSKRIARRLRILNGECREVQGGAVGFNTRKGEKLSSSQSQPAK